MTQDYLPGPGQTSPTALRRAVDHIEANADSPIALSDIAGAAAPTAAEKGPQRSLLLAGQRRFSEFSTISRTGRLVQREAIRPDRPSVLLQLLGEHHNDAAGTADVRELVDVLIGRHTAQRTASVLCGRLKGFVDVVD